MEIKIVRVDTSEEGTFGVLLLDGKAFCNTLELPWKNNTKKISCIPAGKYSATVRKSAKFDYVPEILNVPGRSDILIHPGNVLANIEGCIMVGKSYGKLKTERALFDSRLAMDALRAEILSAKKLSVETIWLPGLPV